MIHTVGLDPTSKCLPGTWQWWLLGQEMMVCSHVALQPALGSERLIPLFHAIPCCPWHSPAWVCHWAAKTVSGRQAGPCPSAARAPSRVLLSCCHWRLTLLHWALCLAQAQLLLCTAFICRLGIFWEAGKWCSLLQKDLHCCLWHPLVQTCQGIQGRCWLLKELLSQEWTPQGSAFLQCPHQPGQGPRASQQSLDNTEPWQLTSAATPRAGVPRH